MLADQNPLHLPLRRLPVLLTPAQEPRGVPLRKQSAVARACITLRFKMAGTVLFEIIGAPDGAGLDAVGPVDNPSLMVR